MEKYFKPVHSPHGPDETKPRKHHHHHHHHLHHQQDPQSNRYTLFDDPDRNTDEGQGHQHRHQQCHSDPCHQTQQHNREEDEILYNQDTPLTLSRASSSLSSSSSTTGSSSPSSFSSWYTNVIANDPFTSGHDEQPQHSLSCSNIADVRRGFREDDGIEPIVFATVKHGKNLSELHESPQKKSKHRFSSLDRSYSRSDEGFLPDVESDLGGKQSRQPQMNYGSLYKSTSLNRSLAFSEEDIVLGVSRGPKRAVSSTQLPGKGILKNKVPHTDIRKVKSMEVLSPRVSKGQDPSGQKGKGMTQAEIEQARANVVQGKLQFSAFLDEITKQVISPSNLTILGASNNKAAGKTPTPAQAPGSVKPQLPPKEHGRKSAEDREQHRKQQTRQERADESSPRQHSDCSNPDRLMSYPTRNHHHGSPPPKHCHSSPKHNTHHGSKHKERRPSPTGGSVSGDKYVRCGPHLTDGTSTSPEPRQPKRHHRKQQPAASYGQHTQHLPQHESPQVPGSESSSTKSDSSRARDTASSATSNSVELSSQRHLERAGHCKQCRGSPCDAEYLRALQEENADLHQNLLQTVICIESLEAELQRTRDELSSVKENYKSLLETHTGAKQANNLLGEHLHIASESLSSERKYLLNRVSQLSSELEDAHRTMAALENINVPCLIKELLEKHFNSPEAIHKFLMTPVSHSAAAQADSQSHAPKTVEDTNDWLMKSDTVSRKGTAFIPFKQGVPQAGNEDSVPVQRESSHSPPFSVDDISNAIYKNISARYTTRPQPLHTQTQQQPLLGTDHVDTPPNLQQALVGGNSWSGNVGVKVPLLEQDAVDVTSVSAQQILDEFLRQLHPHQGVAEGKEQLGGGCGGTQG